MNQPCKLLVIFICVLALANIAATSSTDTVAPDFTPYSSQAIGKKPHPIVPEPSTYGAIFTGLALTFVGYRRWRNRA